MMRMQLSSLMLVVAVVCSTVTNALPTEGDPKACDPDPCKNNGRCIFRHIAGMPFPNGYYCSCNWRQFSGPNCEIPNACLNNPCPKGDICSPSSNDQGRTCEQLER